MQVIPPDLIIFVGETGQSGFKGVLFPLLAPLIDGTRTVQQIADALKDHNILHVHHAMTLLEQENYIVEADDGDNPDHRAFGDALDIDPQLRQQRLTQTSVQIVRCGRVSTEPLETLLDRLLIRRGEEGDLLIVVTDDYLRDEIAAINRKALRTGLPWMLIKPVGSVIWIGPIFSADKSACWACLAERLRQNLPFESFAAVHGAPPAGSPHPAAFTLASTSQTAFGLAATEILRWVVGQRDEVLAGTLVTIDLMTTAMKKNTVVRLPRCPECGAQESPVHRPITLSPRARQPLVDGGYRSVPPGRTIDRFAHHVSALTGIVDRIKAVHEDDFIQVYSAGYAFPPGLKDRDFLDKGLRNTATGKGMSAEQARASALCEALERFSGVYRGSENRRRARYAELAEDAVHPNACMLFSPDQYERRRELNERSPDWIPEPFDQTKEVEWSPLWSLSHATVRYLPTACCYYGCPCPPGHDFGRADSNGCAAGNTVEEAILQGFMEVVERDAVALWWYNRIRRPEVDLAGFDHPYFAALQEHYRGVGRRLWVLDITSDFGIPAFAALSLPEADDSAANLLLGFGAHFDPTIGVMRALTEMNQFLPSALRGRVRRLTQADLDDTSFLLPDEGCGTRVRRDYVWSPHDDLRQDVEGCVRATADRGMELLVLDQTRPDVGLPVVKVVVAGMRPFWGRFAPGRLYTVPVELGWLAVPTREEEMNRSHLII